MPSTRQDVWSARASTTASRSVRHSRDASGFHPVISSTGLPVELFPRSTDGNHLGFPALVTVQRVKHGRVIRSDYCCRQRGWRLASKVVRGSRTERYACVRRGGYKRVLERFKRDEKDREVGFGPSGISAGALVQRYRGLAARMHHAGAFRRSNSVRQSEMRFYHGLQLDVPACIIW